MGHFQGEMLSGGQGQSKSLKDPVTWIIVVRNMSSDENQWTKWVFDLTMITERIDDSTDYDMLWYK